MGLFITFFWGLQERMKTEMNKRLDRKVKPVNLLDRVYSKNLNAEDRKEGTCTSRLTDLLIKFFFSDFFL